MPLIWILGLLGAVGIFILGLDYLVTGESSATFTALAAVPLIGAILLMIFRVVRGHYDDALNEP